MRQYMLSVLPQGYIWAPAIHAIFTGMLHARRRREVETPAFMCRHYHGTHIYPRGFRSICKGSVTGMCIIRKGMGASRCIRVMATLLFLFGWGSSPEMILTPFKLWYCRDLRASLTSVGIILLLNAQCMDGLRILGRECSFFYLRARIQLHYFKFVVVRTMRDAACWWTTGWIKPRSRCSLNPPDPYPTQYVSTYAPERRYLLTFLVWILVRYHHLLLSSIYDSRLTFYLSATTSSNPYCVSFHIIYSSLMVLFIQTYNVILPYSPVISGICQWLLHFLTFPFSTLQQLVLMALSNTQPRLDPANVSATVRRHFGCLN